MRKKNAGKWAIVCALVLVISLSVVFSLNYFLAGAEYTQDDLDIAQEKESALKQALEDARAEAGRLEPYRGQIANAELNELLDNALSEMRDVMDNQLHPYADSAIFDIYAIGDNEALDDFDRYNLAAAAVDGWTNEVNLRINELKDIANEMFDEYAETFSGSGVDMDLARQALMWEVNHQRGIINNAIITFFNHLNLDPEPIIEEPEPAEPASGSDTPVSGTDTEEPEPAEPKPPEHVVYDALRAVWSNLENAVYDLPNWVDYCIISEINDQHVYALDQEWREAMQELADIKRELNGYDYSFIMSDDSYRIGSGEDIVVMINGDYEAIENELYFDIYDPVWSDEMNDYVLVGRVMIRNEDYTVDKGLGGGIMLTICSSYLDTMESGVQLFSLYYLADVQEMTDVFIEIMAPGSYADTNSPVINTGVGLTSDSDTDSDSKPTTTSNPEPVAEPAPTTRPAIADAELAAAASSVGGNLSALWLILIGAAALGLVALVIWLRVRGKKGREAAK